jgi:hypothetical protein
MGDISLNFGKKQKNKAKVVYSERSSESSKACKMVETHTNITQTPFNQSQNTSQSKIETISVQTFGVIPKKVNQSYSQPALSKIRRPCRQFPIVPSTRKSGPNLHGFRSKSVSRIPHFGTDDPIPSKPNQAILRGNKSVSC